jgi:hypothetical protein
MVVKVDEDELIEHWTLVGDELGQVAGKRGVTRLGFSLLLKFYARHGRFPRGRGELPDEAVAYVARQVGVLASDLGFYGWDGRTWSITVLRSVSSSVSASARWRRARGAVLAGPAPAIQGARHRPVNERGGWLCLDDPDEYDFMACRWPVLRNKFVPGPPATGPGRLR